MWTGVKWYQYTLFVVFLPRLFNALCCDTRTGVRALALWSLSVHDPSVMSAALNTVFGTLPKHSLCSAAIIENTLMMRHMLKAPSHWAVYGLLHLEGQPDPIRLVSPVRRHGHYCKRC